MNITSGCVTLQCFRLIHCTTIAMEHSSALFPFLLKIFFLTFSNFFHLIFPKIFHSPPSFKKEVYLSKFIVLFLFDCAGCSLPCRLFSSCREWGLFCVCGARASHCGGLPCCGALVLGRAGFRSCSTWAQQFQLLGFKHRLRSCSVACGIFLDQGLNLCLLH